MRDVLAMLGIVLLLGMLLSIPLAITRVQRGLAKERLGEITLWATGRGMTPTDACAVPTDLRAIYAPIASFAWKGGVLSAYTVSARGDTTHSLWWAPPTATAHGPAYATANRFGSSVGHTMPIVPTNDAAFDEAFAARAQDPSSVASAFTAPVRQAMLANRETLDTVSWDGTGWSITQRTRGEAAVVWDRALAIFEQA